MFGPYTCICLYRHMSISLNLVIPVEEWNSKLLEVELLQVTSNQRQETGKDPRSVHSWTAKDMSPQDGKTFVVMGASSGIGYSCAESIAKKGGHVIIAGRSLERCQKAAGMIRVGVTALQTEGAEG